MLQLLFLIQSIFAAPRLPNIQIPAVSMSPGFQLAAENLKAAMNLSIDPCTDFYEFSCGKWMAENPIPGHLPSFSKFNALREEVSNEMRELYESREISSSAAINKLRIFYRACMNQEAIDKVAAKEFLRLVEKMKSWPMIHGDKWNPSHFDLTALLIKIADVKGVDLFIESSANADMKNVNRRRLQFHQGILGLGPGSREYFINEKRFGKQMNAYRELLIKRAVMITKDAGLPPNQRKITKEVDEVLKFERKLAEITVPDQDRRNFSEMYNERHFNDLKKMVPMIDYERYFLSLMPSFLHSYIKSNPVVVVSEPEFFENVNRLLNTTDPRIITNYVFLRLMSQYALQLGSKYDDLNQDFAREMLGQRERSPHWQECMNEANSKMSYAAGSMYVRRHFNSNSKDTTMAMVANIMQAFHEMLKENDWMDEETKRMGEEKANQMIKLIGYPDFIVDDQKLEEWYQELDITENDSYSQIQQKTVHFLTSYFYKRLLEPVDRSEFSQNAATVNAFYTSIRNAIIFPAAFIQLPFFHPDYPKALNYGAIGTTIGHEITHGFDDQGRQFDGIGNLRQWWDQETLEKYTERTKCIVEQYGSVTVPEVGLNINGILTQGENIADNGGIKESFRAYRRFLAKNGPEKKIPGFEEFSNEQMFFMGYAQSWCSNYTPESLVRLLLTNPHIPGKYRVNVVLQNQPEFAEAFKCPKNSAMNPAKRCAVW